MLLAMIVGLFMFGLTHIVKADDGEYNYRYRTLQTNEISGHAQRYVSGGIDSQNLSNNEVENENDHHWSLRNDFNGNSSDINLSITDYKKENNDQEDYQDISQNETYDYNSTINVSITTNITDDNTTTNISTNITDNLSNSNLSEDNAVTALGATIASTSDRGNSNNAKGQDAHNNFQDTRGSDNISGSLAADNINTKIIGNANANINQNPANDAGINLKTSAPVRETFWKRLLKWFVS